MTLTKRDRILLIVLGAAVLLFGGWHFLIQPPRQDLADKRDELSRIETETAALRGALATLSADPAEESNRTAESLRLSAAVPDSQATPDVVLQLQRLADVANVELTAVKVTGQQQYGSLFGTTYEVQITGPLLDVDDFMYRAHRLVRVAKGDRPVVRGRLLATTSVDISLAEADAEAATSGTSPVRATLTVLTFSTGANGTGTAATNDAAATGGDATTTTPTSGPATTTGTTTGGTTTTAPATSSEPTTGGSTP